MELEAFAGDGTEGDFRDSLQHFAQAAGIIVQLLLFALVVDTPEDFAKLLGGDKMVLLPAELGKELTRHAGERDGLFVDVKGEGRGVVPAAFIEVIHFVCRCRFACGECALACVPCPFDAQAYLFRA